jgi:DNA ligase-4
MEDLERMAQDTWHVPDAGELDGHAKEVALLVKKYVGESHVSVATEETTQETTQRSSPRTTQETALTITPRTSRVYLRPANDAVVEETQQRTYTTVSTSPASEIGSTQGKEVRASRELRVLVREDTSERLALPTPTSIAPPPALRFTTGTTPLLAKKRSFRELISPPNAKRRKILSPLQASGHNHSLGAFDFDSQDGTIHIYAKEGLKVQVHSESVEDLQQ